MTIDALFQDLQDAIMQEYEPGWERTQALTRFFEAYCWVGQCTKKPTEPLDERQQLIKQTISPWDGTGVIVSKDEFISIMMHNSVWQIVEAASGSLTLYVKGERGLGDRIYFGPNPNNLEPAVATIFMDQVRRLQRSHNQVTGPGVKYAERT